MNNITEFIQAKRPSPKESSVHYGAKTRFTKAEEQAELIPANLEKIICLTNTFLAAAQMKTIENPLFKQNKPKDFNQAFYKKLKAEFHLLKQNDLIWMKFTKDGFLGAVAAGDDINFNIPTTIDEYNDRSSGWKYTTSGILIHHLQKEWNEDFVLIFPLVNIPLDLKRSQIECGIGNYLIKNNVPILDYYSHNY